MFVSLYVIKSTLGFKQCICRHSPLGSHLRSLKCLRYSAQRIVEIFITFLSHFNLKTFFRFCRNREHRCDFQLDSVSCQMDFVVVRLYKLFFSQRHLVYKMRKGRNTEIWYWGAAEQILNDFFFAQFWKILVISTGKCLSVFFTAHLPVCPSHSLLLRWRWLTGCKEC